MRTGPTTPLTLTMTERETLPQWVRRPKTAQALAQRAQIILTCAESTDEYNEPLCQDRFHQNVSCVSRFKRSRAALSWFDADMVGDARPVAMAIDILRVWHPVVQRLVRALAVVEREILRQATGELDDRAEFLQIHLPVPDAAPQPFDTDLVQGASTPIHADGNAFSLEYVREYRARELRALVTVENIRLAHEAQRVLKAVNAERRVHAVVDLPGRDSPRVPVDDRHQIHAASRPAEPRLGLSSPVTSRRSWIPYC